MLPYTSSKRLCYYLNNCFRNEIDMRERFFLTLQGKGKGGRTVSDIQFFFDSIIDIIFFDSDYFDSIFYLEL